MSSLSETMVKLCFFFANRRDSWIMFLRVLRKGTLPLRIPGRVLSLPPFPFLWDRERNRAITQNYERIWGDPEFILIKTKDFLYLPFFFFFYRKSLSAKICPLLKFCRLFICDINSFLCECDISDNITQSLIAAFPKGAHRVYVAKNKYYMW